MQYFIFFRWPDRKKISLYLENSLIQRGSFSIFAYIINNELRIHSGVEILEPHLNVRIKRGKRLSVLWEKKGERGREDGVYRWRRQLSAPLTAGRERRCCRRTADRVNALSEHGEPARSADLAWMLSTFNSPLLIRTIVISERVWTYLIRPHLWVRELCESRASPLTQEVCMTPLITINSKLFFYSRLQINCQLLFRC